MNDKIQSYPDQITQTLFHEELNIDFIHYLRILRKHRWSIIGITLLLTAVAVYKSFSATPIYRATATLLIESQNANVVSIEEIYGYEGGGDEYYQTQFELLKSRALAEKVVEKLNLADHPFYNQPRKSNPFSINTLKLLGLFNDNSVKEKSQKVDNLNQQSQVDKKISSITGSLMGNLTIEPIRKTQLVKISYQSPDPELAATVANSFGDTYIESYLDAKMELTQKAAEWLSDRLGGLQIKLDESERRLIEFREKHQLIDVEGAVGRLNEQKVTAASNELSAARRELAEKESLYKETQRIKQTSPELLDSIPAVQEDTLVRTFKLEFDQQRALLDELSNRYGAKHPKIVDAKSRLKVINNSLNRQIDRVIASLKNDYDLSNQKVLSLRRDLASSKREIQDINKKKVELNALEREVEANRKLYDTFFNRIRETDETDGLEAANARISDRAITPTAPIKPRKMITIGSVFIMALVGSILLSFLREYIDDSIKGADEIESKLGVVLLGIIPLVKKGFLSRRKNIPVSPFGLKDRRGTFTESIHTIRTSLCLDSIDEPHKKVVVTSSIPGEGKSTLAINLAYSLSKIENVILVDADMRRPSIAETFELSKDHIGLADYLKADTKELAVHISECVVRNIHDSNLDIIPCGNLPENPLELLSSDRFSRLLEKLCKHYDRVILDCAPTQAVSDALVVGNQADTVIYAIKSHATSLSIIRRGLQRLRQVGVNILGVTITQVDVDKISSYGGDYYYQGYYDYYGYNNNVGKKKKRKSKPSAPVQEVPETVKQPAEA